MKRKLYFFIFVTFILGFSIASAITEQSGSKKFLTNFTPKTNANEIIIVTPENKTYTEADSGYYPATFGFENDLSSTPPQGLVSTAGPGTSIEVIDDLDGHKKITRLYDGASGGNNYANLSHIFSPQSTGVVEFWFRRSGVEEVIHIDLWNESIYCLSLYSQNRGSGLAFEYFDGTDYVTIISHNSDQWYHHRLDFNCTSGTFDWYIDEVLRGADLLFRDPTSYFVRFTVWTRGWGSSGYNAYIDGLGTSWDSDYNVGDNLNEGLLLSYKNSTTLDWKGYSIDEQANKTILGNTTIPMPSYGKHKIQVFGNNSLETIYQSPTRYFSVAPINIISPENITYTQPMGGYYPATYGFESDLINGHPSDWSIMEGGGCTVNIVSEIDGHKNVVDLYDNGVGGLNRAEINNTFTDQTVGTIEFWFRRTTPTEWVRWRLWDGSTQATSIGSAGGYFVFANDTWNDISPCNNDQWYHISVEFNTVIDSFNLTIDGIRELTNSAFINDVDSINILQFYTRGWGTTNYRGYVDAVGYSWDPNYINGNNLNEGLLLSYENSTNLHWTSYSLDGQANNTIYGNKTIPIPSYGPHTIQIFGNNSLGTIYQSTKRHFSVSPINLITPESTTYTEPMNGYYPGTYGFENEEDGEVGTEVEFITRYESDHSEAYASIEENINGRNMVLKFYDAATTNNYNFYAYHDFPTKIPYGTIEFWVLNTEYSGDRLGIYYHFSNSSGADYISVDTFNSLFYLIIDGDNDGLIKIHTGNGETTWSDLYSDDTWHHIRIDFESSLGGYLGLEQYKLNFWFDGIRLLNNEPLKINDSLGVISSHSHGWDDTRHDYLDAVGFSWDPSYDVGDNLYEGLLVSYENRTNLDWIGYSLDGQNNKTILGPTTIPMPNNELHSLELSANDTSGTYHRSNLRYFSVLTSGPTVSATSPLPNQYFGFSAPSFNVDVQGVNLDKFWYSLDDGVTNVTYSSDSGGISQSEWDTFPHGSVQIDFYANDSFGRIGHDTIVIFKDINAPTTSLVYTLSSPPNEVNDSTQFTFTSSDDGSGVSITEYKINNGSWTTYTEAFTFLGFNQGTYTITYRSVDLIGNIESEQFLNVELIIPPPEPPEPPDLSFLLYIIIIGVVLATVGILYFKVYRPRTAESRELKRKNRLEQKRLNRERLEKLASTLR